MAEIGIGGEENIKNLFQKKWNLLFEIYWEANIFFLNIFLYIINITYIDINNKLKIKLKTETETKLKTKW